MLWKKVVDDEGANVCLDDNAGLVPCEGGHCARSIRPNTRQRFESFSCFRHTLLHNRFCRPMEHLCTPIVPKSLPGSENISERRRCKLLYGWKLSYERLIKRHYAIYLRLLQHHLGNQNPIWVYGLAPRQLMPTVFFVKIPDSLSKTRI